MLSLELCFLFSNTIHLFLHHVDMLNYQDCCWHVTNVVVTVWIYAGHTVTMTI